MDEPPITATNEAHQLSESLNTYMKLQGLGEATTVAKIAECWQDTVGESLAAHAQPGVVRGGELVVIVDHPAWATEVNFMALRIMNGLSKHLGPGVISGIKVHVRG